VDDRSQDVGGVEKTRELEFGLWAEAVWKEKKRTNWRQWDGEELNTEAKKLFPTTRGLVSQGPHRKRIHISADALIQGLGGS
jgi:hypothetical protein